jgi:rRNA-processing protein FCF1
MTLDIYFSAPFLNQFSMLKHELKIFDICKKNNLDFEYKIHPERIGELEKLGPRYKVALRIAKDHRFRRLTCTHKGTYADDCLCDRVKGARCYIVATCDKDLRRRIRKVPGVPIMFISQHKYTIERMVEAFGAPRSG